MAIESGVREITHSSPPAVSSFPSSAQLVVLEILLRRGTLSRGLSLPPIYLSHLPAAHLPLPFSLYSCIPRYVFNDAFENVFKRFIHTNSQRKWRKYSESTFFLLKSECVILSTEKGMDAF